MIDFIFFVGAEALPIAECIFGDNLLLFLLLPVLWEKISPLTSLEFQIFLRSRFHVLWDIFFLFLLLLGFFSPHWVQATYCFFMKFFLFLWWLGIWCSIDVKVLNLHINIDLLRFGVVWRWIFNFSWLSHFFIRFGWENLLCRSLRLFRGWRKHFFLRIQDVFFAEIIWSVCELSAFRFLMAFRAGGCAQFHEF